MKSDLLLLHGALGSKEELTNLRQQLLEKFNVYILN